MHMERRRGEDVRDDDGQIMVWCAVCVWEKIDEDRHSRHFTVIDDLLHPRGSSSSSFFCTKVRRPFSINAHLIFFNAHLKLWPLVNGRLTSGRSLLVT